MTGFESSDGFSLGNLDGQGDWFVETGTSVVQNAESMYGTQAVRLDPGATIGVPISGGGSVVWIDAFVRTGGTTNVPSLAAMGERSSVVYFGSSDGVQPLDGDGSGSGVFLTLSPPATLSPTEWRRITLRQDYTAHTWDLYIDGSLRASGLGFKDNTISSLSGLRQYSEETAYLDAVSATTVGLTDDSDSDQLSDLDEVKIYGTDPNRPDSDSDGKLDGDEVAAGTSPTDPDSRFHASVAYSDTQVSVQFSTVSGKQYTVEWTDDLVAGSWTAVSDSNFVNRPGSGNPETYVESPAPTTHRYYRVEVSTP